MMDFEATWAKENVDFVKATLGKLEPEFHIEAIFQIVDNREVNIWTVLAYLAKAHKITSYLEVGVRRGFSMALVGARRKRARLTGFDLWIPGYGSSPNPGPDFVRAELQKVGHKGPVDLISGDSAETIPFYITGLAAAAQSIRSDNYSKETISAHIATALPQLILVDAGHSRTDAHNDFTNCLRLLAPGGYLVADDLIDPEVNAAWEQFISERPGIEHYEQDRVGVIRGH